jgi:hypothetical protein
MKTAKPSHFLLSTLVFVLGGAAAGCGISVEADVPEVEITRHDVAFDGVPVAALIGDVSVTQSFSQKHDKLELPDGLDSEVKPLGVTVTAKAGIQDFGFVHNFRVLMSDDVHDPVELVSYEQDPAAAPSNVLTLTSANPVNVFDQWKTSSATFTIEVAGSLPPNAWSIDLGIRFSATAKYTYK